MMRDLFEKIYKDKGPLGKWASLAEGYFVFPKLEGQISNRMKFQWHLLCPTAHCF